MKLTNCCIVSALSSVMSTVLLSNVAFARIPEACSGTYQVTKTGDATQTVQLTKCIELNGLTAITTVKNVGTAATKVGLASYQKFEEQPLDSQILFDSKAGADGKGVPLAIGESVTLQVNIPDCAAQVDLFFGAPITDYHGNSYCGPTSGGCRLIDDKHSNIVGFNYGGKPITYNNQPYCVSKPVCNAGGPYINGSNGVVLACSNTPQKLVVNAGSSSGEGISYKWSTSCVGGMFDSAETLTSNLTLPTLLRDGQALTCGVTLTVTDRFGGSSSCVAPIAASTCSLDCAGTVNGSAVLDACGVCGGNGTTCPKCESVNVQGTQLSLDVNVASLRNNAFRLARAYKDAGILAGLSSTQKKSVNSEASTIEATAQTTYQKGWTTVYASFPGVVLSCTANTTCINTSTISAKSIIAESESDLAKVSTTTAAKVNKLIRKAKQSRSSVTRAKAADLEKRVKGILATNVKLVAQGEALRGTVPSSVSSCAS